MTAADCFDWRAPIGAALARRTSTVARPTPDRWHFALRNGRPCAGQVRLESGWLLVDLATEKGRARVDPWRLLEWNAGLPGGAKYALADGGTVRVRLELPLGEVGDGAECAECVDEALASVGTAWRRLATPKRHLAARTPAPAAAEDEQYELDALCRAAGWRGVPRSDGRVAVDLEVADEAASAELCAGAGCVQATVALDAPAELSPVGRRALALLLLAVSGAVRMVRAAAWPAPAVALLGLECVLAPRASAGLVGDALAALRTGYRLCAREVRVLADDSIARAFLSARGVPASAD